MNFFPCLFTTISSLRDKRKNVHFSSESSSGVWSMQQLKSILTCSSAQQFIRMCLSNEVKPPSFNNNFISFVVLSCNSVIFFFPPHSGFTIYIEHQLWRRRHLRQHHCTECSLFTAQWTQASLNCALSFWGSMIRPFVLLRCLNVDL